MLYIPIITAFFSLLFAFLLALQIQKSGVPGEKIGQISLAIREGAKAFLKRELKVILTVAAPLFIILWLVFGINVGIGFLAGSAASFLAGFIGMMVSTNSNARVTIAAKKSLERALKLSFRGGAVTGFLVAGLALLSLSLFWLAAKDLKALAGLAFGASLISIFARLGGGIYTKAADVGADLVGKAEKGIPEDDPRNPAVIADQVGDTVGDCAGMAADLFETYIVTLSATMILGSLLFKGLAAAGALLLPLMLGAASIIASAISVFFVRLGRKKNIMAALYKGIGVNALISALFFVPVIALLSPKIGFPFSKLYLSAIIGIVIAFALFAATEYYTSKKYRPVREIARASVSGHGTNIITGLSVGMEAVFAPVIIIIAGVIGSFSLGGMYGLGIAAVALLSLTGIIIAMDSYGPITDNAAGIAEMSGEPEEVRANTDALDAVGNTTKAVTKACAIGSAGLAALVLFSSYTQEAANAGASLVFSLKNPKILAGLFLGGLLPYMLGSFSMRAVGKAAGKIVNEVRRQFKEIKGLMEGQAKPEYSKCVDIVTRASLREMLVPTLIIIALPIFTGFLLGAEALGGLLIGIIVSGFFMAVSMCTGGAAWDNAKKYIEEGNFGGKGSFSHRAAITGDTVGDPYKDTAGPAMNPMIKVVNVIALLIVGLIL